MRRSLLLALCILLLPFAYAHTGGDEIGHHSAEELVIRVTDGDPAAKRFTFTCVLPENSAWNQPTWSVRTTKNARTLVETKGGSTFTYDFANAPADENDLFHIACQMGVIENGQERLARGDFHLDFRSETEKQTGYSNSPNLYIESTNGLSFTARCIPQQGTNPTSVQWRIFFAHGEGREEFTGPLTISKTLSKPGLWDIECGQGTAWWPSPVEFFSSGPAYVANANGCVPGEVCYTESDTTPTCTPTTEVCDSKDNDCDGQTDENNVCSSSGTCYNSVKDVPVTCTSTITQDTWNGCRQVVCGTSSSNIKTLACDKGGFFEVYKQSSTGAPPKVCFGQTCIQSSGYEKSSNFPICTQPPACTPTTEVCDSKDNDCDGLADEGNVCASTCTPVTETCNQKDDDCDGQVDEGDVCSQNTCYSNVKDIPASCTGGSITTDTFDGACRKLVCSGSGSTMQALACNKGGFFEMYRQSSTGSAVSKVCLGATCVGSSSGFAKSSNYPICTGSTTPTCTPTTETCNQKDDDCDGQIDENNVCTTTSTCYNSVKEIPATCSGGSLTTDSWNGCRTLVCSSGSSSLQVLACDKSGFFEMYKQAKSGTAVTDICIGSTCIGNNGYVKSGSFPVCTGSTTPTNSTGITWIEPSENQQNTPPNFFHLNVMVPSNEAQIQATEWEVWNNAQTERVWYARNTGSLRFHTHTPDGTFQGSLAGKTQLAHSTTYKVRVRFMDENNAAGQWSSWRTFTTSAQQTGTQGTTWSTPSGFIVERFATGFDVPVHVARAPQQEYMHLAESQRPFLYVTELYGTIKVVYRDGSSSVYASNLLNFEPFGSITGGGQMGLIGLYVDDATGDLIVGMTYVENDEVKNKVVRFFTSSDGRTSTGSRTLISNLPSAPSHQVEQITKGPDGKLYINLGDALNEQNAQSDTVLAGRIIRMNMDGTNVETYAKGLRNPFGADWRPGTNQLFATDNSPDTNDRLLRIVQGENYLWGAGGEGYVGKAIDLLNPSPVDVEFNPGNTGFPSELTGRMYVAVGGPIYQKGPTNGKEILEYALDASGNIIGERQFLRYTGTGYGTPIGLDFGPDGLYFTDIYGEPGFVGLGETEGNIYRIKPGSGSGCVNCGGGSFRAALSVAPWYPKYISSTNSVEYVFECNGIDGSGNYVRDWNFGNGQGASNYPHNRIGPVKYPYENKDYTVSCTVKDQGTGKTTSASMVINPGHFIPEN